MTNDNKKLVVCVVYNKPTETLYFWTTKDEPLCKSCHSDLLETYDEYQFGVNVYGR